MRRNGDSVGKIVCLMGKSSSGKDTIYKKIIEQGLFGLQPIVPYTTRPVREGEQDGVEYHFTDEDGYQRLLRAGKIVESRAYSTCLGLWRYFTVADESIDLEKHSYILIGTLEAYLQIRKYYGADKVLPVMIELDDGERLQRALNRERAQKQPGYEELCRRFLADAEDFAPEKLRRAGIERSFCNLELEGCLREITQFLQGAHL